MSVITQLLIAFLVFGLIATVTILVLLTLVGKDRQHSDGSSRRQDPSTS